MSQLNSALLQKLQNAMAAHRQGQLEIAAALYREILLSDPGHFDCTHLLGLVEMQCGRLEDAIALMTKAVGINNRYAPAYSNLSVALRNAGRLDEAMTAAERAVKLQSDNYDAQYNRALVLLDLSRYEQALSGFRKAVALGPTSADAHMNLGIALLKLERLDEALESLTRANTLRPHFPNGLHNLGHLYQRLKQLPDAVNAFKGAIAADSQHAEARVALSECLMQMGDYAQGWAEYEWRWSLQAFATQKRTFTQPAWTGADDISGKTLLIYAEQGMGDTLMFARYLKHVRERGARIVLDVQPALKSLFAAQEGLTVIAYGEQPPAFDAHCALLSLPFILNTGADFCATPYIQPPQDSVDKWKAILDAQQRPAGSSLCGIVWSAGTATRGTGLYRSMPVELIRPLTDAGVKLIGIQHDVLPRDQTNLAALAGFVNVGPDFADFADTAGAIANLDLVITVDTATAHLAGAMGKPVWILMAYHCDWRWQMGNDANSTVWYPSARLFHQPKLHDWQSVVDQVASQLQLLKR